MTTGLRIIQASEVAQLFPAFPTALEPHLELSNPIFAGFYHSAPFCIISLVPQRTSGTVAIWGWNTPLVADHPYIYLRWGRRLIPRIHTLYPTIIGECPLSKLRWLRSLGATFTPGRPMFTFHIEAPQ